MTVLYNLYCTQYTVGGMQYIVYPVAIAMTIKTFPNLSTAIVSHLCLFHYSLFSQFQMDKIMSNIASIYLFI